MASGGQPSTQHFFPVFWIQCGEGFVCPQGPRIQRPHQGEGRSSWLEGECRPRGARAEGAPMGQPSYCRVSRSHAEFLRTCSGLGETYLRAGCVTPFFLL